MRHIVGLFVFYLSYVKGMQYCYECSSKSALCRHSVYDGQYLSKTPCSSSCFLRIEGDTTFRGCFDGWLEGLVNHNYVGCRHQKYLGETVEWCFCQGSDDPKKNPCNGVSHDELAKMAPSGNGDHVDYDDSQVNYVVPTYPTQPTSGDGKAGKEVSYEDQPSYVRDSAKVTVCKEKRDGTYADPHDCTRYYHCSNGLPYRMRCSAGTIWNSLIRGCTFAYNPLDPCRYPGPYGTRLENDVFGKNTYVESSYDASKFVKDFDQYDNKYVKDIDQYDVGQSLDE